MQYQRLSIQPNYSADVRCAANSASVVRPGTPLKIVRREPSLESLAKDHRPKIWCLVAGDLTIERWPSPREMTHAFADWQVTELARLAETDRERAERALNALWAAMPGLFEELASSAGVHVDLDERELSTFALVETGGGHVARLSESRLAVWEVVRMHRRCGSIDELCAAFPSVDRVELEAAVTYGTSHPAEVDTLIARYESMLEHKRQHYPYAK